MTRQPHILPAMLAALVLGGAIVGTAWFFNREDSPRDSGHGVASEERRAGQMRPSSAGSSSQSKRAGSREEDSMTPDEARKSLENYFAGTSDVDKRAAFSASLIVKLCKSGHSQEALELVDKNYGRVRDSGLVNFFLHADLPEDQLLALIPKLSYDTDFDTGLRGFVGRFRPEELARAMSSPNMKSLVDSLGSKFPQGGPSELASGSLHVALMAPEVAVGVPGAALELYSKGLLSQDAFAGLAEKLPGDAFEKWDMATSIPPEAAWSGAARETRNRIVGDMVISDGPKAVSMILSTSGDQKAADLRKAISRWTEVNPQGAADWYAANKSNLAPQDQSVVASTFSREALFASDFASARQWAETIQDPEAKANSIKAIEEQIAQEEKNRAEK